MENFTVALCKGTRLPESGDFFALGIQNSGNIFFKNQESWALESGMQLKESGIQYLESAIHGVESRVQNCLGFPSIG